MRSRFTAFALHDQAYLLRSWHESTRPAGLDLDESIRWTRLDVLSTADGGPFDRVGTVDFEAFYRDEHGVGSLREHSTFVREDRQWFYVDGTLG